MKYFKRHRKYLLLLFLFFLILFFQLNTNEKDIQYSYLNSTGINVIFNLEEWRRLSSNTKCHIPSELQNLANSLCRVYLGKNCETQLPCSMISSPLKSLQCFNNSIPCQIGSSLDLFFNPSKPSIIVDSFTRFNADLYFNQLNKNYRSSESIWGIKFNFESISNYPWNKEQDYLNLFDIKFGYDRSIYDFIPKPWLFNYIPMIVDPSKRLSIEQIIQMKNFSSAHSPIVWLNTNCQTLSKRTEYLNELMKYIPIDNYGNCGKKILPLPDHIVQIQQSKNENLKNRGNYQWEKGKLSLLNEYLFTIAFENTFDYDYVTEKIWHAFITGSVPIYTGAPNINDWLPSDEPSIINLNQFQTPKQAAQFIQMIAQNQSLYLNYHQWRNKPISHKFDKMLKYFESMENYSLECLLCYVSHKVKLGFNKNQIIQQLKDTLPKF